MLFTDCESCDQYWHANKPRYPPEKAPEEYRKQNHKRRDRQRDTRDPRFKITSDEKPDEVQAGKNKKASCHDPDCASANNVGNTVAKRGPMNGMKFNTNAITPQAVASSIPATNAKLQTTIPV
jgi:hypothetical protein